MKDVSKIKNYRTKFKKYYGIDFSNDYEIHHIDLDRGNNNIENLMILPRALHHKYHFYLSATKFPTDDKLRRSIDAKICGGLLNKSGYEFEMLAGLIDVLRECAPWYDYKLYLDGIIPNVHNIELH